MTLTPGAPMPTDLAQELCVAIAERNALREQANSAHAALDEAGVPAHNGVLSDRITALAVDLDRSKHLLATATRERADARADQADAEHRRNTLHDSVARMRAALTAAGFAAGFGPDEVEQALAAALAAARKAPTTPGAPMQGIETMSRDQLIAHIHTLSTQHEDLQAKIRDHVNLTAELRLAALRQRDDLTTARATIEAGDTERKLLLTEIHVLRSVLRETVRAFERLASMDRP